MAEPDCVCGHPKSGHHEGVEFCIRPINSDRPLCGCLDYQELSVRKSEQFLETKEIVKMTDAVAVKEKETLPDGREYIKRALGGFDDDIVGLRKLREMGKHTLLLGEPGCGKTAAIQIAFPDAENEIGHDKLTAWDMLWRPRPMPDGSIQFDPAPLTRAAMGGLPLYVDEVMRMNADALTPLFSAMDGRGFIVGGNLDGTDLKVQPGFVVVGASNPLVRGAFMPDAIKSRFHILTVETSQKLLEEMKIDERLLVIWNNLAALERGECWRPSIRELLSADSFIKIGNVAQAAYALTGWRVPARDRATVAGVIAPILGARVGEMGGVIK